jgi:hypothetical protein
MHLQQLRITSGEIECIAVLLDLCSPHASSRARAFARFGGFSPILPHAQHDMNKLVEEPVTRTPPGSRAGLLPPSPLRTGMQLVLWTLALARTVWRMPGFREQRNKKPV